MSNVPKLDIKKIKKYGMAIFKTKEEMLNHIKKVGFENRDSLEITRYDKKWIVRWK